MTTKGEGPTGWILPKPEDSEGQKLAAAWVEKHKALLDALTMAMAQDVEDRNGDSLMCWWSTLLGMSEELHTILTRQPVEVVPEARQ